MYKTTYINFFGIPKKILATREVDGKKFAKIEGYKEEVLVNQENICNEKGYSANNTLVSWRMA
jgi:hypothetical protein